MKRREQKREGSSDRPSIHRYNVPLLRLLISSSVLFRPFFLLANRETSTLEATTLFPIRPGCACHCRLTIQRGDTCMTYRLPATVTSCHDALLPTDALLINFTSSTRPRETRKREMETSRRGGISRGCDNRALIFVVDEPCRGRPSSGSSGPSFRF